MGFDVTGEPLNDSFFIAFSRIAKLAVKAVMRSEFEEFVLLFSLSADQDLLDRCFQIIVKNLPWDAIEEGKCVFVSVKKGFLTLMRVKPHEEGFAMAEAKEKQLAVNVLTRNPGHRWRPIALGIS
jgi:hypothetical protein